MNIYIETPNGQRFLPKVEIFVTKKGHPIPAIIVGMPEIKDVIPLPGLKLRDEGMYVKSVDFTKKTRKRNVSFIVRELTDDPSDIQTKDEITIAITQNTGEYLRYLGYGYIDGVRWHVVLRKEIENDNKKKINAQRSN